MLGHYIGGFLGGWFMQFFTLAKRQLEGDCSLRMIPLRGRYRR